MRNIVVSGCSFSAWKKGWVGEPYSSWPYHIPLDGETLHNVSLSGSGNYIVSLNAISLVDDLIKKGTAPKDIYVVIQWTGIFRPTVFNTEYKKRPVNFKSSYSDFPLKSKNTPGFIEPGAWKREEYWANYFTNYFTAGQATVDTLDCILKTQWYLKSKGVEYTMFTGWDIFTSNSLPMWIGQDIIASPSQFTGGKYNNIDHVVTPTECEWTKSFWEMVDFNKFWFFENKDFKLGGLTQWTQANLPQHEWYKNFPNDPHPSLKAHKKFALEIIHPRINEWRKND